MKELECHFNPLLPKKSFLVLRCLGLEEPSKKVPLWRKTQSDATI